ncbi:MAG: hypothetical protein HN368_22985, partial [Spirochaetales bacterium]|nr:hypothetical protein [Spirochaetales bacterium]
MISNYITRAQAGESVFITDVREAFSTSLDKETVKCLLSLPDGQHTKFFKIPIPSLTEPDENEMKFIKDYINAEVYNHLTTLGGLKLDVYINENNGWLSKIMRGLPDTFGIGKSRDARSGFGRITNVSDRMLNALYPSDSAAEIKAFELKIHNKTAFPGLPKPYKFQAPATTVFSDVTQNIQDKVICGLDIGGTDIKAAIAYRGSLAGMKEYDWNPAVYGTAEELIHPILAIVRLLRAQISYLDKAKATGIADESL